MSDTSGDSSDFLLPFLFGPSNFFLYQLLMDSSIEEIDRRGPRSSNHNISVPMEIWNAEENQRFKRLKFFGKGGFGRCYQVKDLVTNHLFACKVISKSFLQKEDKMYLIRKEVSVHRKLKHKNIVSFEQYFEDQQFAYIMLELCVNRSLLSLIARRRRRSKLTEVEIKYYMKGLMEGIEYMHRNRVVHRDIKLSNLLLNNDMELKIADFGLATSIDINGEKNKLLCGTPNYMAPEMLTREGHSFPVDIWAAGCILYTLVTGVLPFKSYSMDELYDRIKLCDYKLPESVKKSTTNLICKMLQLLPENRPTATEILKDEFFNGYIPERLPKYSLKTAPKEDLLSGKRKLPVRRKLTDLTNRLLIDPVPRKITKLDSVKSQNSQAFGKHEPTNLIKPLNCPLIPIAGKVDIAKTPCYAGIQKPREPPALKRGTPVVSDKIAKPNFVKPLNVITNVNVSAISNEVTNPLILQRKKVSGKFDKCVKLLYRTLTSILEQELNTEAIDFSSFRCDEGPKFWVNKWLDLNMTPHTFAYQLSNGNFGCVFDDRTWFTLLPDSRLLYIDDQEAKHQFTFNCVPLGLTRKLDVLLTGKKFMIANTEGIKNIVPTKTYDSTNVVYVKRWHREKDCILIQLTNGTVQVNFSDHRKILLCPFGKVINYIDEKKQFHNYSFNMRNLVGCDPILFNCLKNTANVLKVWLNSPAV